MPKPKKGENKQDFLKRCTTVVMAQEGMGADKAFAMCNVAWDDAKSQRSSMVLNAPLVLAQPGEGENQARSFMITAYTGAEVVSWYGRMVIDVSGIKAAAKMPVLREHLRDRVVGYSVKAWKDKQNFLIQGEFSQKTKDGTEVFDLASEGFPWQASIGVWPETIQILQSDKETAKVNGRDVAGPLEIWRQTTVREVSFCALGADAEAAAIVLAAEADREKVPVVIERAQIKEAENMDITLKLLEEKAPGLLKEIQDAARAEVTLAVLLERQPMEADKLRLEGVTQERLRVTEILEADGDHTVSLAAIQKGTPAAETFKLLFRAEKEGRDKALLAMQEGAPKPLGQAQPAANGATFEAKVTAIMAEQKLTRGKAIKLAAREFPELHAAYIARQNPQKK